MRNTIQPMSKLANQWIELFRAGKADGKPEFTLPDLDEIVANYKPSEGHEAPITVGHPEPNSKAPAYGWIEGLRRVGASLWAKPKQVEPQFEEAVEAGRYKKRSVGLVKRDNGWNLHHVAFLGAQAPAIKGLAAIQFTSEADLVQVEFEESAMANEVNEQSIVDKVLARFAEIFGGKKAGEAATFSEADVKRIAGDAAKAAAAEAVAPVQAKLDAAEAKFAQRETALTTKETMARGEAAIATLKTKGRWIPAFDKMGLPLVFAALATIPTMVEFGEGTEKKTQTPLELFTTFMETGKAIVPTGTVYDGQQFSAAAASQKGINAGRAHVDEGSLRLDAAVKEYAEKNKVEYTEAYFKVLELHPELNLPGAAAAGQV